jgi:hypothetical protein
MAIIQHRRDTSAALANQTAAAGEIFFETDTNRMKVGDGITKHSDLPYLDNEIVLSEVEGLVEQLAGKAPVSHNHPIEDIDGLRAELDGKADATHGQSLANLDRTGAIDGQVVTWSDTLGKWVPSGQSIAAGSFDGGTVSNAVHAPDGSESTPAYSFTSNTGSGMFVAADGSIRLAAGQTVGLAIDLDGRVSLPQGLALSNLTPDGSSTDTYYFVSYQGRFYSIPSAGAYKAYGQTISNGNDPSAADIFDTYAVAESFAMSLVCRSIKAAATAILASCGFMTLTSPLSPGCFPKPF